MKRILTILIFTYLLSFIYAQNEVDITFIANDGFLIRSDTTKILIDGIFAKGNVNFTYPPDDILLKERNATEPFDSIDFLLNTHYHADHINAAYVVENMLKDTASLLFCTPQSYDLVAAISNFDTLKNRIISINPATAEKKDTTVKGMNFKISRLVHNNDEVNQHQVNAYIFTLNGICFFHPGDGGLNDMSEAEALNLDDDSIDIAFLPYWMVGNNLETTGRQLISYLNPRIIIIMHVRVGEIEYFKNRITEIENLPPVYYLDESFDNLIIQKSMDSIIVKGEIVALNNISPEQYRVFPNPTNGRIQIELPVNCFDVKLFSIEGRQMLDLKINSSKMELDLSSYKQGIYLLHIKTAGNSVIKKIFKE